MLATEKYAPLTEQTLSGEPMDPQGKKYPMKGIDSVEKLVFGKGDTSRNDEPSGGWMKASVALLE